MDFDSEFEVLEDRLRAGRGLVVITDRTSGRFLVPDVLGERRDLAQLVVREEVRAVGLAEIERDLQRVGRVDRRAEDVVRVLTRGVARPVVLVRGDHVLPELDVTRGDLRPVRPLPALEGDGDRLAVRGIHGRIGEAQAGVQLDLAVVAEPVQRPVHEVLELTEVGNAEVLEAREREDVVRLGTRTLSERRRGLGDSRACGAGARAPARREDDGPQADESGHRFGPPAPKRHVCLLVTT